MLHQQDHLDGMKATLATQRMIMISNRLPVTVVESNGKCDIVPSSGGLATGLGSFYRDYQVTWLGWAGKLSRENQHKVAETLLREYRCQPVFLSERIVERYYEGFSNRTIWPLFHSFQSFAKYSALEWESYRQANLKFLFALEKLNPQPGDRIWVHDYQLLLLPQLIREKYPWVTVGFFLHIPFPPYDIYRLLPQHKEIIASLLSSDLVGFHTHDYMHAFLNCAERILGLESRLGQIIFRNRSVQAGVFPMGIDFEKFNSASNSVDGTPGDLDIRHGIGNGKLIFSVSRLDYTKGIPQSLDAFELFLKSHPQLHGQVAYLLVVVPSREKIEGYAALKREIDETVGRINACFGRLDWTPIRYIYRSLSFPELVSLYKNSHVALVTPLRDGMNLIAKEYVASHTDNQGVLILSEMAGASKELVEALTVNPNSVEDVADAIFQALQMAPEEQTRRMQSMRRKCQESHVRWWAETFSNRLLLSSMTTARLHLHFLTQEKRVEIAELFKKSAKRLFVLDYDGSLVPFHPIPAQAKPDSKLIQILELLSESSDTEVAILSGRDKSTLGEWLSDLNVTLIAEHGAWIRRKGEDWKVGYPAMECRWKTEVRSILEAFVENIPGSLIEEKDYSLVWHYRTADMQSSETAARELIATLLGTVGNQEIQVLPGKKTVEIRSQGVGKGICFKRIYGDFSGEFIFAAGDDYTDEELFRVLPDRAVSVKVGQGFSRARFRLGNPNDLRNLLRELGGDARQTAAPLNSRGLTIRGNPPETPSVEHSLPR